MTHEENTIAALKAADRLFKEALPKFNWGASFLDANAIQLLNEVPGQVRRAIEAEELREERLKDSQ